jgi:isopentenyl-diphosphate Delta-isomerase
MKQEVEDEVILVNDKDEIVGYMPKLEAHQKGELHRAFSILVFNKNGDLLIHQRAFDKYHSAGLWTNTCCSHPKKGENAIEAANRRLQEEMGFQCELKFAYKFLYKTDLENDLIEHELDHVFIGEYNENPNPNPLEVANFKWVDLDSLKDGIQKSPENYTFWFKKIVSEHLKGFRFNTSNPINP